MLYIVVGASFADVNVVRVVVITDVATAVVVIINVATAYVFVAVSDAENACCNCCLLLFSMLLMLWY